MNALELKKIVAFSCAGHIALFALLASFGFSFGSIRRHAAYTPIIFCGSVFPWTFPVSAGIRPFGKENRVEAALFPRATQAVPLSIDYYVKPEVLFPYALNREPVKEAPIFTEAPKRKDPVLLMHPLLPYRFELYFNDRQTVNIELEFEISRVNDRNFVSLRRKISSGNLEADLLSMRYIGHYLFNQQARFMPETRQSVKIEFSPHSR